MDQRKQVCSQQCSSCVVWVLWGHKTALASMVTACLVVLLGYYPYVGTSVCNTLSAGGAHYAG